MTEQQSDARDARRVFHVGRSWWGTGTPLEDACPCPQEPCGLVAEDRIVPGCPEHDAHPAKTLRTVHPAGVCLGHTGRV